MSHSAVSKFSGHGPTSFFETIRISLHIRFWQILVTKNIEIASFFESRVDVAWASGYLSVKIVAYGGPASATGPIFESLIERWSGFHGKNQVSLVNLLVIIVIKFCII